MCGEIDDQAALGQELLEQLSVMTRRLGPAPGRPAPEGLAGAAGRAAYTEALFRDALDRALADMRRAAEDEAVDACALQAIALGRLAGFLAGQLPPEADLFRAVIEAVTDGHGEPRRLARDWQAEQDALHGHSHDHGDDHHHHHAAGAGPHRH